MKDLVNDVKAMLGGDDPSAHDGWDEGESLSEPHKPWVGRPGEASTFDLGSNLEGSRSAKKPKPDPEPINEAAVEQAASLVEEMFPSDTDQEYASMEAHMEAGDDAGAISRTFDLLTPGSHKVRAKERKTGEPGRERHTNRTRPTSCEVG